jgi:acetone carboxylase, gamma subunit
VVLADGGADERATGKRREEFREQRLKRARPVREWWKAERERVLAQEMIEPIKVGYAEAMRLSERWAAEFRGFWDLPEDFDIEALTPTVEAQSSVPGKITPEESADEFLAGSSVAEVEPGPASGRALERDTLAAMLDEKLSRREIRQIQSSYKDPDRFDKWLSVLQERVSYDQPIVLPMGEGLNVVRRDGELVIRCDCGHDFCPPNRNWKMEAVVFIRDDPEKMLEIFPKMAGGDTDWMELREFFCPDCARQLEVDACTPGYPVIHDFLPDIEGFYRGWLGRELP